MKRQLFTAIVLIMMEFAVSGQATIDLNSQNQLIRGFGGINVPGWINDLTPEQAQKAFGNGTGEIGMSILRVRVPYDSVEWKKEVPTALIAKQNGAIIFGTPWTPPSYMKSNEQNPAEHDGGHLNPAYYSDYAKHLKGFCDFMRNAGVPLYAISIQNEPDYDVNYESCDWTSQEFINFLNGHRNELGDEKIIVGESFQFRKPLTDAILNSSAINKFDIVGAHIYGGGLTDYPLARQKGKEVWMTEHYTSSDRSANLWPDALNVAKEIHDCMHANYNAYVWWYIRRSYGMLTDDGNVSKRGYCMAQFSKFIRPGAVRINSTSSPKNGVYVSAYKKDDNIVIVAINTNSSSSSVSFSVSGIKHPSVTQYTTSGQKNVHEDGKISLSNGSFTANLDGSSVSTFVAGTMVSGPEVTITSPSANDHFVDPASITITADAKGKDAAVSKVEFFDEQNTIIGQATSAPYTIQWKNVTAANHRITAKATDEKGNIGSASLDVKVNGMPFNDNIFIYAKGTTGTEILQLIIDDTIIDEWTLSTSEREYTAIGNINGIIRINFANDDEQDRDVTLNYIKVADKRYEAEDQEVNTAHYANNKCGGGGFSEIMNCTGYVEFLTDPVAIEDQCPNSDKIIPGICGCDEPDIDSDNDGVLDCNDECPFDENKTLPGECGCGVAEGTCNNSIMLAKGWNLIGYPLNESTNVTQALSSIWNDVEVIKNMDVFFDKSINNYFNLLQKLEYGEGYMIKVKNNCELIFTKKQ